MMLDDEAIADDKSEARLSHLRLSRFNPFEFIDPGIDLDLGVLLNITVNQPCAEALPAEKEFKILANAGQAVANLSG